MKTEERKKERRITVIAITGRLKIYNNKRETQKIPTLIAIQKEKKKVIVI